MAKKKEILSEGKIKLLMAVISLISLVYGTFERISRERHERKLELIQAEKEVAEKEAEHAKNIAKDLVVQLEQNVKFRYDEYGNYIKEKTTLKVEVEIIREAKNEVIMVKDSLLERERRRSDTVPRMGSIKPKFVKL